MSTKTKLLAEQIINSVKANGGDIDHVANMIKWHWDDATKVLKNIKETSTNETDRTNRIIEFEEKFGLSKTHVI